MFSDKINYGPREVFMTAVALLMRRPRRGKQLLTRHLGRAAGRKEKQLEEI